MTSPHPAASNHSGRTSRIDAYTQNHSPQPFADFFWEARLAGANRDRVVLHASPVPSHGSQVTNPRHQTHHPQQQQDINSIRYTRVKTDLRDDDPDADLKMQANRQWKESIERQIEEKRKRDMMEKQRDELEESMRFAKAMREQQAYASTNMPTLKPTLKEPPPVDLGPVPDIQYTQKAYSITKDQMREHTRIPRFRKELFHPSPHPKVQEQPIATTTLLPKIATTTATTQKQPISRNPLRPPQPPPPPQKSIVDRRFEQETLGVIPGSNPHQPRYYIPKRPKQAPPSSTSTVPATTTTRTSNAVAKDKMVLPSISSSTEKTAAPILAAPTLSTSGMPATALSPGATSAVAKSPASIIDPRSPNKPHQVCTFNHPIQE